MPQYFGKLQTTEQPWSIIGSVQSINKTDRTIHFNCGETSLNISILAPNLIRVRMSPTGEFNNRSYSITLADEEWEIIPFEVRETDEKIEIETAQILISVKRSRPAIECFDKSGKPFASDGDRSMGWRAGATAGWKRIEADEHFYGFGERIGFLDKLSEVKTNSTTDSLDYNSLTDEMYQASGESRSSL
jgi:alpha-glucosidase